MLASTIDPAVELYAAADVTIDPDKSASHINPEGLVKEHKSQAIARQDTGIVLPWVRIAISNAEGIILDSYHDLKSLYL